MKLNYQSELDLVCLITKQCQKEIQTGISLIQKEFDEQIRELMDKVQLLEHDKEMVLNQRFGAFFCQICQENMITNRKTCSTCQKSICINCNNKVSKCPYCRTNKMSLKQTAP